MTSDLSLESGRPVIVCGMPRSGTSLIGQFLKNSGVGLSGTVEPEREHVRIYPELHPGDVPAQFELLTQIEGVLSQSAWQGLDEDLIGERLLGLLRAIWRTGAPESGVPDEGHERFGLKNPLAELFYEQYRRALGIRAPLWVYCVRDPLAVYESTLRAMGAYGDLQPKAFAARYQASVSAAESMDPIDRFVVRVDDWSNDVDVRNHQAHELLSFLGIEFTQRSSNFLQRWPEINRRSGEGAIDDEEIRLRLRRFERIASRLSDRMVNLSSPSGKGS